MQLPFEIVFRNMDPSDFVRKRVEQEIEKLERFHSRITSCQVVVEAPHKHHRHGKLYQVSIHMTLPPGQNVDVTHTGRENPAHEDVYVAIRDAFKAAVRPFKRLVGDLRGGGKG